MNFKNYAFILFYNFYVLDFYLLPEDSRINK